MALISCPECRIKVSDKEKKFPHCKYQLVDEEDIQKVEAVKSKPPKKKVNKKIILTILIPLIILGIGGGVYYKVFYEERAAEKAKLEKDYYKSFIYQLDSLSTMASKCIDILSAQALSPTGTLDVYISDLNSNMGLFHSQKSKVLKSLHK